MQELKRDYDVTNEMLELNERIMRNKEEIVKLSMESDLNNQEIKKSESILMEEITNELTADNKPLFKNSDQRNAELINRLSNDSRHQKISAQNNLNKLTISRLTIENEFLIRTFDTYKIIGYLNCK